MSDKPSREEKQEAGHQKSEKAKTRQPDSMPIPVGLTITVDPATLNAGQPIQYTVKRLDARNTTPLNALSVYFASYPKNPNSQPGQNVYLQPQFYQQHQGPSAGPMSQPFTFPSPDGIWPYLGMFTITAVEYPGNSVNTNYGFLNSIITS